MDGENNGTPIYFLMDDLGVPLFWETLICKSFQGRHLKFQHDRPIRDFMSIVEDTLGIAKTLSKPAITIFVNSPS